MSTINFHSRAASQPRNLGNCHTLAKFIGDDCPQINNSICNMLWGVGWDKNPVLNAVYRVKNFNSLFHNAFTLFRSFLKVLFLFFEVVYYHYTFKNILVLNTRRKYNEYKKMSLGREIMGMFHFQVSYISHIFYKKYIYFKEFM